MAQWRDAPTRRRAHRCRTGPAGRGRHRPGDADAGSTRRLPRRRARGWTDAFDLGGRAPRPRRAALVAEGHEQALGRSWAAGWPKPVAFSPTKPGELSGRKIALDPGHNLGNSLHLSAINQTSWVGLTKTCNTSGTATNAGYPEASYAFDVVARLRRLLAAHGATVYITRDRNTTATYGPCVGARGSFAAQEGADLMVSVHGDGAAEQRPRLPRDRACVLQGLHRRHLDRVAIPRLEHDLGAHRRRSPDDDVPARARCRCARTWARSTCRTCRP